MPRLYVLSGPDIGRTHDVAGEVWLGRAKDVDVPLRSPSVSRRHARLELEDGCWFVVDEGSSNGVVVDGRRVRRAELADGTQFRLGEIELRFRIDVPPDVLERSEPAAAQAPGPTISPESTVSHVAPRPSAASPEPRRAPAAPRAGRGDEIVLEGDWSDDIPPPSAPLRQAAGATGAPPSASLPAAASASTGQGARPASARQSMAQRAAALGAAPRGAARTKGGSAVLQYHRVENRSGILTTELGQQPAWLRWLAYAFVALLFAALIWGAMRATVFLRGRNAPPVIEES